MEHRVECRISVVRTTMILTSRFFLKVVGSSIIRMGHRGDLGGEPLPAPPAPEWSLGNELSQE